jgi:putative ABC transport system permease protein
MVQKLLHKKWMVFCLLIGNVLLIATAASYPMYKNASLKKMLDDELAAYSETADDVGLMTFFLSTQNGSNISGYNSMILAQDTVPNGLEMKLKAVNKHFVHVISDADTLLERDDMTSVQAKLGTLSNLAQDSVVLAGRMFTDEVEDGVIEAVVTGDGLMNMNLLVGETLEFRFLKYADGSKVKVKIVGVVDPVKTNDGCWVEDLSVFDTEILIPERVFNDRFLGENLRNYYVRCNWFYRFDENSIQVRNIDKTMAATEELLAKSSPTLKISEPGYLSVLKRFVQTENKITVTLIILQVPVMALLLAFLFMISGQMLNMEQNEISLLKSRGASKKQIGLLYLLQSSILSLVSLIIGLPLGVVMCKLIGSSEAFLEFGAVRTLSVKIDAEVMIYAFAAVLASILVTLIPALSASGLSIVRLKAKKARSGKKLWQKLYLDVVILGISLYGYYSFSRQTTDLASDVLEGNGLDPLLYLSSVLFILGAGMVFLRIQPLIVKLIFAIGKKRWKPDAYASFLQIIRTGSKQQFMMLFLVLTVSLGIFDSTVARTIISNAEDNIEYLMGSDIVLSEVWPSNINQVRLDPTLELVYREPDFGKYGSADDVEKAARVYYNTSAVFKKGSTSTGCTVMGIDTKEFGEALIFDSTLLGKHINNYLNEMAVNPDNIIVSESFEKMQGMKIGDKLTYTDKSGNEITGVICAFVDYWPTFRPSTVELLNDGTAQEKTQYLIVSHLSVIQAEWGKTPYRVFMKLKDGRDASFFNKFINGNGILLTKYTIMSEEKEAVRRDTLFQGTNGILTMSFIIILILCLFGYLIYWIMSIRSRELLFGVLRAMGMKKAEIIRMLFYEQTATGIFSIIIGGAIGFAASRMFVPMIQLAYAGENQVTPLSLTMQAGDLIRLFSVILVMILVCIVVLSRLISGMKITNALKLGED